MNVPLWGFMCKEPGKSFTENKNSSKKFCEEYFEVNRSRVGGRERGKEEREGEREGRERERD